MPVKVKKHVHKSTNSCTYYLFEDDHKYMYTDTWNPKFLNCGFSVYLGYVVPECKCKWTYSNPCQFCCTVNIYQISVLDDIW